MEFWTDSEIMTLKEKGFVHGRTTNAVTQINYPAPKGTGSGWSASR